MAGRGKEMLAVVGISGVIDKKFNQAVDGAQKKISKISPKALKVAAAVGGIGTAAFKAGKVLASMGSDYQRTMGQLQASTGASAKEMERLGKVVQEVYKNNFGESMDDVADAVSEVQRNMKLSGKDLQNVTQDAIALRDVFGYDVAESSRAAEALVKNFGISGQRAYNLIAAGAQNGLDYSGELLDSISEYSVQFKKQGMSADQMFRIMEAGANAGAWNLDKIGDAVKENAIRAIDLSDSSVGAFQKIGLDAEKIGAKFAAGGSTANEAFTQTIKKIGELKDPLEQDAVGVALFGTMWEDLSKEAVLAMGNVSKAAYGTGQEMKQLQKAKYNNLQDAFQGIGRVIEVTTLPYAQKLANYLAKQQPKIEKGVKAIAKKIEELTPYMKSAFGFVQKHAKAILGITTALAAGFGAVKMLKFASDAATAISTIKNMSGAMKIVSGATKGFGAILKFVFTNPIGIALAAGALIIANWDKIAKWAGILRDKVVGAFNFIKEGVVGAFKSMRDKIASIWGGLKELVKRPINAVIGLVNKAIDGINDLKSFSIAGEEISIGADIPHIPQLERGGLTDGPSIAGEGRYPEMVISQDPRWRSQNLRNWEQAGQMLGANADNSNYRIGGDRAVTKVALGDISFSPTININGNAEKSDIIKALEEERENFKDMLKELYDEMGAYVYG